MGVDDSEAEVVGAMGGAYVDGVAIDGEGDDGGRESHRSSVYPGRL